VRWSIDAQTKGIVLLHAKSKCGDYDCRALVRNWIGVAAKAQRFNFWQVIKKP
jgi:hypothetical protein